MMATSTYSKALLSLESTTHNLRVLVQNVQRNEPTAYLRSTSQSTSLRPFNSRAFLQDNDARTDEAAISHESEALKKDIEERRQRLENMNKKMHAVLKDIKKDNRSAAALRGAVQYTRKTSNTSQQKRSFSVLSRPPPNYPGHVPLNTVERVGLAVGSALASLINPRRHEMVAACGEATAQPFFIRRLRDRMLADPTGRRILRDRPRITSKTMSLEKLRQLPDNSVGRTYAQWLDREGVTPDTRDAVKYIDNEEEAYVMQRYRECHDFYHAIAGLPVWVEGEIALKAFEFANTGLPMTGLSLAAIIRLKPEQRKRIFETYLPWAFSNGLNSKDLINVYWEEELETDVDELRTKLGIEQPPDLRETRRLLREERKKSREGHTMTGEINEVTPPAM